MEHDVSGEIRPQTLDYKVDRAIANKTYQKNSDQAGNSS